MTFQAFLRRVRRHIHASWSRSDFVVSFLGDGMCYGCDPWMRIRKRKCSNSAATEQLNSRRGTEHTLVEAQTRITQLDQMLQRGGRLREGVAKLGLRDEGLHGSHRPAAVGGHDKCRAQRGCDEQRQHDATQAVQECAVVFRLDHVAHWHSLGSRRQRSAWRMAGAWRRGGCCFKRIPRKNSARS